MHERNYFFSREGIQPPLRSSGQGLSCLLKAVMNQASGLVKNILQKANTSTMNSSARPCSRARQGEFRSGAQCCHFVGRPLIIQRPMLALRSCRHLLFCVNQRIACYWPIDDIKSGVGIRCASCLRCRHVSAPRSIVIATLVHTGITMGKSAFHDECWRNFFPPFHRSLRSFQCARRDEKSA